MSDLISRKAAVDAINALHDMPNAWLDCAVDAVMALPSAQPEPYEELDFVQEHKKIPVVLNIQQKGKSMPSAQLERKRGQWIYCPKASGSVTSTAVHLYPVCSECGREHPVANFCPNCGADMRGG